MRLRIPSGIHALRIFGGLADPGGRLPLGAGWRDAQPGSNRHELTQKRPSLGLIPTHCDSGDFRGQSAWISVGARPPRAKAVTPRRERLVPPLKSGPLPQRKKRKRRNPPITPLEEKEKKES